MKPLCKVCQLPMNATVGQIVNYHKECRKYRNNEYAILLKRRQAVRSTMVSSREVNK